MLTVLSTRASGPMILRLATRDFAYRRAAHAFQRQGVLCFGTTACLGRWDPPNALPRQRAGSQSFLGRDLRGTGWKPRSPMKPGNFRQRPSNSDIHDEILEGTADERDDYVTKFADLATKGQVSSVLIDTVTRDMGLETMTQVQSQTINEALEGVDLIAQARTGTGKTLAFLIPILQNLLAKEPSLSRPPRRRYRRDPDIRAIILSPTRELAEQIAAEARRLVVNTGIVVQTAVGGTQKREGMMKVLNDGCHILVGTPGRMKDIFSDQMYGLDLSTVHAFILDEADRLLDDGFFPDIQEIESYLPPKESRQNMLFSATVPREVLDLARTVLNKNFRFVQTIQKGELQTHEKVPQKLSVLNGLENQLPALLELILGQQSRGSESSPFKALVFLNSTAETKAYATFFQAIRRERALLGRNFPVFEIHSRLSQAARTRQAEGFRRANQGIMFTSDVSARGMDYPNVSHVIQLGLPRTRDFYVHRIGRTGRGERAGEAWLFLSPLDVEEARRILRGLPLVEDESLTCACADMHAEETLDPEARRIIEIARNAAIDTPSMLKVDAFKASLGYMSWVSDKRTLVDNLKDQYILSWGEESLPSLDRGLASRLGVTRFVETRVINRDGFSRGNTELPPREWRPSSKGDWSLNQPRSNARLNTFPSGRRAERFDTSSRIHESQERNRAYG